MSPKEKEKDKEKKRQELYAAIMRLRFEKQNKEISELLNISLSTLSRIVKEGTDKDWDYKGKGQIEHRLTTALQEIEDSRLESLSYFKFLRDVCVSSIKRHKPTGFDPRQVEALAKIVDVARKVELDRINLLGITPPKTEETTETYLNIEVKNVPIEIPSQTIG